MSWPSEHKRAFFRFSITSTILKGFLRFFSLLPLRLVHALGIAIGFGLAYIPSTRRRTTHTNLAMCFPDMSLRDRKRLARHNLIETGKTVVETGALWLWDRQRVLDKVRQVDGEQYLESAMARGKGVILAFPHLGAWEMVNVYCSTRYSLTCLYRRPRIKGMDQFMLESRQRLGASLVPNDVNGVRALLKTLKAGNMVGILPDQCPKRDKGSFAPFFGIQANTMTLLSRLLEKTAATLIFAYAERLPAGKGYHVHFRPPMADVAGLNLDQSLAAINDTVEACVRDLPDQYLWCYKRFRVRPLGEKGLYSKS